MKAHTPHRYLFGWLGGLLLLAVAAWSWSCGVGGDTPANPLEDAGNAGALDTDGSDTSAAPTDAAAIDSRAHPGADSGADLPEDTANTDKPADLSIGVRCTADDQCNSGYCDRQGRPQGTCTTPCETNGQCPSGWTCRSRRPGGDHRICTCQPTDEICDGADNDCDGLVDEGDPAAQMCGEQSLCLANTCRCPAGFTCSERCRDLYRDLDHCGRCGHTCPVACSQARCVTVTDVDVGTDHICVLLSNGQVRCAGQNTHGQLGDGTTTSSRQPVDALWMKPVDKVVAADQFSCAATADGQVHCWGDNSRGQVAPAPLTERHRPTPWEELDAAVDLDADKHTGCAVTSAGRVYCWGPPEYAGAALIEGIENATRVAVGAFHRCALLSNGRVACWGDNEHGQLGDGTTLTRPAIRLVPMLSTVVDLAAGAQHTCVRTASGAVQCFGDNSDGQLGVETSDKLLKPAGVVDTPAARDLTAGANHTCVIGTSDDAVYCWGDNDLGQLGDGTTTSADHPVKVHGLPAAQSIAAGGDTTCAVTQKGDVSCWGERFGVNPRRVFRHYE